MIYCEGASFRKLVGSPEEEGYGVYGLATIDGGGVGGVKFQEM